VKAAFRSDLDFRDLNRGSGPIRLLLLSDLVYDSAILVRTIRVPAKFVTDLASIPQILWNILPPIGAYDAAAVVHDYLYTLGGFERSLAARSGYEPLRYIEHVTRGQADRVLLEAMEVLDVEWWKRRAIYAGVRVGGWKAWGDHRAENRKAA
jgi:hypothetical protein